MIRRTSFNETWKSYIWLWLQNKSNLLNFLPAQEPRRKEKRSGFSTSALTLHWAGLPFYHWNPVSAEQPWTSQCLSTVWTEIHFTVPVRVGEKGIHSFPPLSGRNVVLLSHQGHQLRNRAGKIKQTKAMLHQSPLPNPGRSLDMDAARDGCAWSKNNVCLPGGKGFCSQLKKAGRVPDSHLQNELTLSSQCNFAFVQ